MTTPLRALKLFVLLATLFTPVGLAQCKAYETLAEGFEQPVALALDPHGALYLLERGAGRVTRLTFDEQGEVVDRSEVIDGLEGSLNALALVQSDLLLVSGDGISVYLLNEGKNPEFLKRVDPIDAAAPCTALAVDPKRVFALVEGRLFRSRHERNRLTLLRPFEREAKGAISLTVSQQGYLVALRKSEEGVATLAFYDPHLPGAEPVVADCEGFRNPLMIAYAAAPSPVERLLYALDEEGVFYRLDAAMPEGGQMRAKAVRVGAAPGARCFVVMSEASILALATGNSGPGKLIRISADQYTNQ